MQQFNRYIIILWCIAFSSCKFATIKNEQYADVILVNSNPANAASTSKLQHATFTVETPFQKNQTWQIPNTKFQITKFGIADSTLLTAKKCTPSNANVALYANQKLVVNTTPLACLYQWGMSEAKIRMLYNYNPQNGFNQQDFTPNEWAYLQSFFNAAQAGDLQNQNPKIQRKALKNQVVSLVMGPPEIKKSNHIVVDSIVKITKEKNVFQLSCTANGEPFTCYAPTVTFNENPALLQKVLSENCPEALQNIALNSKTIYAFEVAPFANFSYIALNEDFANGIHIYNLSKTQQVLVFSVGPTKNWSLEKAQNLMQNIGAFDSKFLGSHTFSFASVDVSKSYYSAFNDATFQPLPGFFLTSETVAPFGDPNSVKAQEFMVESATKKAMIYADTAFIKTYFKF